MTEADQASSDRLLIAAQVEAFQQRLLDTANYLRGLAAVVENLNRGAADSLYVAIGALVALSEDMSQIRMISGRLPSERPEGNSLR